MSKAFTRERDDDDDDQESPAAENHAAGVPNYITPQGHAALSKEMQHLLRVERPRVVETVSWAASNGDRSENGDYIYGKRRLREIDRRLRFLTRRLAVAKVTDSRVHLGSDQIFFGAWVTVVEGDSDEQTFRIVGVDETHLGTDRISWVSPMARALLRSREGDRVSFLSPSGPRHVDVLAVSYDCPDDSPDDSRSQGD
jgi:transcription elongation factor GreB